MQIAGQVVEKLTARAFTIPTDAAEADGTLSWQATTIVLAEACASGHTGVGYSYASGAAAALSGRGRVWL